MSHRLTPRGELHWRAAAEVNTLTAGFTVIAVLAVLSETVPGVEEAITTAALLAVALGVTAGATRWVAGQVQEQVEDRADAVYAAHVRAARTHPAAGTHAAAGVRVGGGEGS
jgi:hypothetical protein